MAEQTNKHNAMRLMKIWCFEGYITDEMRNEWLGIHRAENNLYESVVGLHPSNSGGRRVMVACRRCDLQTQRG